MHPLVPPVLFRMPRFDPLDLNPQPQPPHGELAQPIERMRRREWHPVVGPDRARQAEILERPLKHGEREGFLRRRQGIAGQQVPTRKISDGQRVAVPPIAEHKLALVVGAPEDIRRGGA